MPTTVVTDPTTDTKQAAPQLFLDGRSCARCGTGIYLVTSTKAGSKRLSKLVGYVVVPVAVALMAVGLTDLLGIGISGSFPLFFPGATLGALAALMIQWGNCPPIARNAILVCSQCGLAPPDEVWQTEPADGS